MRAQSLNGYRNEKVQFELEIPFHSIAYGFAFTCAIRTGVVRFYVRAGFLHGVLCFFVEPRVYGAQLLAVITDSQEDFEST